MKNPTRHILILTALISFSSVSSIVYGEAADSRQDEYSTRNVTETYLDTLNRGKEISLITDSSAALLPEKKDTMPSGKKVFPEGFRIQLLASSSIEAVRAKKRSLEEELQLKVYVDFDAPYYKVYVGDYKTRKEADAALLKIKQSGYPDAWIVKAQVFVDQ